MSFHGFNIGDKGKHTLDRLKDYLDMVDVDYGFFGLLRVRLCNACVAHSIVNLVPDNSVAIGHSNGCLIAAEAAKYGAPFKKLILINPALNKKYIFPTGLKVDVYYVPTDYTVWWASLMLKHKWGKMGQVGYRGDNPLVTNYNATELFGALKHSDVFNFADKLCKHIRDNHGSN